MRDDAPKGWSPAFTALVVALALAGLLLAVVGVRQAMFAAGMLASRPAVPPAGYAIAGTVTRVSPFTNSDWEEAMVQALGPKHKKEPLGGPEWGLWLKVAPGHEIVVAFDQLPEGAHKIRAGDTVAVEGEALKGDDGVVILVLHARITTHAPRR